MPCLDGTVTWMVSDITSRMLTKSIGDQEFAGQFLRSLAKTYYQCADIGECFAAVSGVGKGDYDAWYGGWKKMADRIRSLAAESLSEGDIVGAHDSFLRAGEYYRQAMWFLRDNLDDPRLLRAANDIRACFREGVRFEDTPVRAVEIPYEGTTLPGYLYHVDDTGIPRPTFVMPGGYDSIVEECYAVGAKGAVRRGYNFLAFDGPGQGHALLRKRLYLRPDFERVISPVLDWLFRQPEVDTERVVLMGRSFGGYLAPRGACGEERLAGLVCDPGLFDIGILMDRILPPEVVARWRTGDADGVNAYFDDLFASDPGRKFYFINRMRAHGVSTVYDYLTEMARYTYRDRVAAIACPTLICCTATDPLAVQSADLYRALAAPKEYRVFESAAGAGAHTEAGATGQFEKEIFGWARRVFEKPRAAAPLRG